MTNVQNLNQDPLLNHLIRMLESIDKQNFNDSYLTNYDYLYTTKKTIPFLTGKFIGKTRNNLKKAETKTAFLIANWAVETFTFAVTVYALVIFGSTITGALLTAFYLYTTYALFSILLNQKR